MYIQHLNTQHAQLYMEQVHNMTSCPFRDSLSEISICNRDSL